MINLALIAPPGAGKGTQSEKISRQFNILHVSTGDIFRAIVKGTYKGSFPTEEILSYMNKGLLVPDSIVVGILLDRLNQKDCMDGFLLDGFPRTINQAETFDKEAKGKALSKVILIDVNQEDLLKRLIGRRFCTKCGKIYNIYYNPPKIDDKCDDDGSALLIRSDDNSETVKQRMEVYEKETAPLIDYYKKKKLLFSVNGNQAVDAVFNQIREVILS